jgi:hypothetical protein
LHPMPSIVVIVDEEWDLMVASFSAAKKPSKWKMQMATHNGEIRVVRYVDGQFVMNIRGEAIVPIPRREALKMQQDASLRNDVSNTPSTLREAVANVLANRTGNHCPRVHKVKVPTASGQPVRG